MSVATALLLAGAAAAADIATPAEAAGDSRAPDAPGQHGATTDTIIPSLAIAGLSRDGVREMAGAIGGSGLSAIDGASQPVAGAAGQAPGSRPPIVKFRSEREAFRTGIRDYNSGDMTSAVQALEYAATRGHSPAQWKLGRMYAEGDGVPHDDLKAFEYFSRVVQGADEARHAARFTANAFVALGGYYLDGIPGSYVKKDEQRAREMFHHAASYYGDPDAQYNLARLCLAGQGGARDARLAARWLHLAAEKNHVPSQALLGHLLITGQGEVARQTPRGLAWLTIARNAADPDKDAWIIEMHDQVMSLVSDADRSAAQAFLDRRRRN